jgi:hypothetical protein
MEIWERMDDGLGVEFVIFKHTLVLDVEVWRLERDGFIIGEKGLDLICRRESNFSFVGVDFSGWLYTVF